MRKRGLLLAVVLSLGGVLGAQSGALAVPITFNFNRLPVMGGDPEDANVLPSVSATFDVTGSTLTIALLYNGAFSPTGQAAMLTSPNQIFSGLLFNVVGDAVLNPVSAVISNGSSLTEAVGNPGLLPDLSGQWAAKGTWRHQNNGRIIGGITTGSLGSFTNVVGAMGDIVATGLPADANNPTLGSQDLFNGAINLNPGTSQPGGGDFGIVPAGAFVNPNSPNFAGIPLVQNAVTITYTIDGTIAGIENVVPLFGTDGLPRAVPEPSTLVLLGSGLVALGLWGRKRVFVLTRS